MITSAPNFPEGKVYEGYANRWRTVELIDGIRVVRVKTFIVRNEGFILRVVDYISYMLSALMFSFAEARPDVVISTSPHLFVPVAGVIFSQIHRRPHVFELRDLWPATIAATSTMQPGLVMRYLEVLELWLYRRSKRILAFTESFRHDLIRRGIAADKIDVVVNGANLDLFHPATDKDAGLIHEYRLADRFVVGYLGTIGLSQGLENALHAAQLLLDAPITLLFVGAGADKELLESKAKSMGLHNVVFVPRQHKNDMPRFWSVCDAALIHLRNDPVFGTVIPSKIFESMAVGLPIIYCGPRSDGSEIVAAHQVGVWVPPADPIALAGAIKSLFTDAPRRHTYAENSVKAAPMYSRDRQAGACLDVLRRAMETVT